MVEYIAVNNYIFRPPSRPSSGCTITWNKERPYKIQMQGVSYWWRDLFHRNYVLQLQ